MLEISYFGSSVLQPKGFKTFDLVINLDVHYCFQNVTEVQYCIS